MKKLWAVFSYSGSMLTPNLVLKQMDTETAPTAVSVASRYEESHGIVGDPPGRETSESRPTSVLDLQQWIQK